MCYVIELTTYVDKKADAKAIYGPYDETEATATFHQKMGGAMKNANYASELLVVVSETGGIIKDEYWKRPVEENAEKEG